MTDAAAPDVGARWRATRAAVDDACRAAGRDPAEVTLVAVSKLHPAAAVDAAVTAGATDVGENYVQELLAKQAAVTTAPRWHFIGHLQRNKARAIAGKVALVHAVDSLALALELGKRATALQPVLLAVNVAGESTKSGVALADAPAAAAAIAAVANLRLDGFMTMPPPDADPRPHFAALRELRDRLRTPSLPLPHLSMGMSADFEIAIAEGATLVRIGTAIFGARR